MSTRRIIYYFSLAFLAILVIGIPIRSQLVKVQQGNSDLVVGRNVNMVHGTQLPDGDPYLQRQNEPSIAASTRNPLHLLAGANDYRTIDMPFEDKVPGKELGQQALGRDAWLGVYKSYDGGQSWITSLLPGFPQDNTNEGILLKPFGTAADPVVRAGTNGLFYYAGIAFNRVDRGSGVVFVARYVDYNDQENGDTIKYDGMSIVDQGNAGQFLDKPWIAVDIPRSGAGSVQFTGQTQTTPCGNVYIAYSAFVGKTDTNVRSKILFARSIDCGHTWSAPIKVSESQHIDQGTTIAIDPISGAIYVAWRRFASSSQSNAIILVKSTDGGLTFTKPIVVRTLSYSFPASAGGPFDQRTTGTTFRTNSHPTIAVDLNGTVYLAWAQRQSDKKSRIVLTYSKDSGSTWQNPVPVDISGAGNQFMPSFAGNRLMLTWYDQRNDIAGPSNFTDFIEDSMTNNIRHTVDVRVAQIDPVNSANVGTFIQPSKQVSRYLFKLTDINEATGIPEVEQVEYHFTGLEMFQKGTVPFLGDYIDITPAPVFLPTASGGWKYNTDQLYYHVAWEDTRDVKFPPGTGLWPDWSKYRAPNSTQDDPLFPSPNNSSFCEYAGMMNQNVYTACISNGFIASSPGNSKPLDLEGAVDSNGFPVARAFTVTVKNMTDEDKTFGLTIIAPLGVVASFVQYFDVDPNATPPYFPSNGFPVDLLAVPVAAQSSHSLPVFVYPNPGNPMASVEVIVNELDTPLTSIVTLNPDPTNPEIVDPAPTPGVPPTPHIKGDEVHNPHIKGKNITNASGEYPIPHIKGLNPAQLDMMNSDTANPHIKGDVLNPHIKGTDIPTPHIKGESISEITWDVTNEGNTTTPYTFDIFAIYNPPNTSDPNDPDYIPPDEAIQFQLLVYKVYETPFVAENACKLSTEEHHELVANIPNPHIKGPHIKGSAQTAAVLESEDAKEATFWLNPGEKALVKLWAIDPKLNNGDDFEFGPTGNDFSDVKAEATATSQAHNTEDLEEGNYTLPSEASVPPGPALVSPLPGAELDNGCETTPSAGSIEWDFDWADVPGATLYHLYVLGPNATIPVVDDDTLSVSDFHYSNSGSYVDDDNRYGWVWMVRAYVNDAWTGWSEVRSFDVAPATDCQGTPAGYTISGKVYYSTTLLDGITVDLILGHDWNDPIQTTISANGGAYTFSSVAPGSYDVKVNGPTSEYIGWTARSVDVVDADVIQDMDLPKIITLLTPPTGTNVSTVHPTLTWTANPEALTYVVQINKTDGWVLVDQHTVSINSYTVIPTLELWTNYTWQVDATDSAAHHVGTTYTSFTFTTTGIINPNIQEINIKQGPIDIPQGGTYDFGPRANDSHTSIDFTIENKGGANDLALTGNPLISISGTNADQFQITAMPTTPISAGQSTPFSIQFSPTSLGLKTAWLSIPNNDPDENPTIISLSGNCTSGLIFSTFDQDTVDQPPTLGGPPYHPTSLYQREGGPGTGGHFIDGTIFVRASAAGISTQPVELDNQGRNQYFGSVIYRLDSTVTSGTLILEATITFDKVLAAGEYDFFLETISSVNTVPTRLMMWPGGAIRAGGTQVGSYQANIPFRVRKIIDVDAATWSVVIDNEMNGFDDDPVFSGFNFENMNPPNDIREVWAAFSCYNTAGSCICAYDDIYLGYSPSGGGLGSLAENSSRLDGLSRNNYGGNGPILLMNPDVFGQEKLPYLPVPDIGPDRRYEWGMDSNLMAKKRQHTGSLR